MEEEQIVFHNATVAWADVFSENLGGNVTGTLYPGDSYLIEAKLTTHAFLIGGGTGYGLADVGPFDGDGAGVEQMDVGGFTFDIKHG